MKKLMLIVNPAAGRGAYKESFGEAMHILADGGYTTTLFFTSAPGDASRYARENGAFYDTVACIGGDGTLSETLAGLMQIDNPPPVGYFPMGTANDVATTLDLPKNNCAEAAKALLAGTPHGFDVGGFGSDNYFAYIAAFGMFTEVSYTTPQSQKKSLGHLAYVLQGAASLSKIESVHAKVEYDDGVIEGKFYYGSLSNSTSVAGMIRLSDKIVSLGDGRSELVLIKDTGKIESVGELLSAVVSQNYDDCDALTVLHTKKAKFTFDKPVAWTRDGEAGGEVTEIELCNFHAPVQLIF